MCFVQMLYAQQLHNSTSLMTAPVTHNWKKTTARSGATELLDSIIITNYDISTGMISFASKEFYQDYNAFDEAETILFQNYDGGSYINESRQIRQFSMNGLISEVDVQKWDTDNNSWEKDAFETYTYSNNNLTVLLDRKNWDEGQSAYVDGTKKSTFYRLPDLIDSTEKIQWNASLNKWVVTEKVVRSYDANNDLLENTIDLFFNDGTYLFGSNAINTYDAPAQIVEKLFQRRSQFGDPWENSRRIDYSYDVNNEVDTFYRYDWDDTSQDWKLDSRRVHIRDNNSEILTDQEWDGTAWVNDQRFTYTFTDQGNYETFIWDIWLDSEWKLSNETKHFYSEKTVSTSAVATNPANCQLINSLKRANIRCELADIVNAQLEVYDLLGRLQYQQAITAQQEVDLQNYLPQGFYLVSIQVNKQLLFLQKIALQN